LSDAARIFFYHGCNWSDLPARQQYLMAAMSRHLPVVFLDGGADRLWKVTVEQPRPNITVVRGLTSVCQRLWQRGLDRVASAWTRWQLRKLPQARGRVIFWCAENWLRPYRFIRHDALIYDCIDPCFSQDPARIEVFHQRDIDVMSRADLVFATADALADFCRLHHDRVTLLNNACEPSDYAPALLEAAPVPAWWPNTPLPIAGYLGSLDWRFDFEAVTAACRDCPDVHFVLAGNALQAYADELKELTALPNVTCPGRISLADGGYLLSRCAIGLIPFTVGPMNDAINPVKMYAYALLGKPIVGTAVRELLSRPQIVTTAQTPQDFGRAVARALARSHEASCADNLRKFALANTWEQRADQAIQAMQHLL
jgi:hypothetical protein